MGCQCGALILKYILPRYQFWTFLRANQAMRECIFPGMGYWSLSCTARLCRHLQRKEFTRWSPSRVLLGSGTSVLQNPVHILLEEWRCREGKGENTENNLWQEIHQVDRKYTKDFSTSPLSLCSALWAEPAPPHPQICLQTLYFKTDMDTVYKKYAAKALPRPRSPPVIDKTELECLVWVLFMIIILTW